MRRSMKSAAILVIILLLVSVAPPQQPIRYGYGGVGRLVGVIDPAADTAVYAYDAVGNLTAVSRYASSTVSILTFSPSSGPVGTTITISGTGFSTTPSQ